MVLFKSTLKLNSVWRKWYLNGFKAGSEWDQNLGIRKIRPKWELQKLNFQIPHTMASNCSGMKNSKYVANDFSLQSQINCPWAKLKIFVTDILIKCMSSKLNVFLHYLYKVFLSLVYHVFFSFFFVARNGVLYFFFYYRYFFKKKALAIIPKLFSYPKFVKVNIWADWHT